MLAKEMVLLGYANGLQLIDDSGQGYSVTFKGRTMALLANHTGNALYLLPASRARREPAPPGRPAGKRLFANWAARDVSHALRFRVPRGGEELSKCGYAVGILYTSDKWDGRAKQYVHAFSTRKPPRVYCDRPRRPRLFGVLAIAGQTLVTRRGIVG